MDPGPSLLQLVRQGEDRAHVVLAEQNIPALDIQERRRFEFLFLLFFLFLLLWRRRFFLAGGSGPAHHLGAVLPITKGTGQRQHQPESGAFLVLAVDRDGPAQNPGQPLRDGQPQTRTTETATDAVISLFEGIEKMPHHFGLHADSRIPDLEDQTLARDRWLAKLNQFLSDPTNSGKAFISEMLQAGPQTINLIEIEPIKNQPTGGELLAEVEETSNIIAYGMGIHPSLIGASPGRSKTISGTEARELFIIKQALLAPVRERLLSPLRIVAAANSWPKDISFRISNLELTTLDRHTGAVRSLGSPAVENPQ